MAGGPKAKPILQRILDKTEVRKDGCWVWLGRSQSKAGHGRMFVGSRTDGTQRNASVHRLAWEQQNGPIPQGLQVLHSCDQPRCVNIKHLFLGTVADNMADRDQKRRQAYGERQGLSKLTADKVRTARRAYFKYNIPITEIATRFDVTYEAARYAIKGITWRHV